MKNTTTHTTHRLFDREGMLDSNELPMWAAGAYTTFRERVLDPEYPCMFGTAAEKKGLLRYCIVPAGAPPALGPVREFYDFVASNPKSGHALVMFVETPTDHDHDRNGETFWTILQYLLDNDAAAWPTDVPFNPDDPTWELCLAETPTFVFGAAPTYERRRARNLGSALMLLFQPRFLFEGIEGGTKAGEAVRKKIRERLLEWNGGTPIHAALGNYGDPSNFEWRQYWLPDTDAPISGACPLDMTVALCRNGRAPDAPAIVEARDADPRWLLPDQGSIELQRDAPHHLHAQHAHLEHEILIVLEGEMQFSAKGKSVTVVSGDRIILPAGIEHASEAGPTGCIYAIRSFG